MSLTRSYQFIFAVETNEISQTDRVYISYLLKSLYGVYFSNNDKYAYKYSFVYMNGKRNFNKNSTIREINKLKNLYPSESVVIYVIDTDNPTKDNIKFNEEILKFCEYYKYEIIYFSYKIEDIFYPKEKNIDKMRLKRIFAANQPKIETIKSKMTQKLFVNKKANSNFITVMDSVINKISKQ